MKQTIILVLVNVFLSLIFSILSTHPFFLSFINTSFIIGMIYFLFGLLCFVWKGGFFDITIYSFNKLKKNIAKKSGLLEDEDLTLEEFLEIKNKFSLTKSLIISGFLISLISTALSLTII